MPKMQFLSTAREEYRNNIFFCVVTELDIPQYLKNHLLQSAERSNSNILKYFEK